MRGYLLNLYYGKKIPENTVEGFAIRAENAESLENKGIPRFSFRFESTSAYNIKG